MARRMQCVRAVVERACCVWRQFVSYQMVYGGFDEVCQELELYFGFNLR